jgi:retinol-binding protein 3
MKKTFLTFLLLLQICVTFSQTIDEKTTPQEKIHAIQAIQKLIRERYIDEAVALKTVKYLQDNLQNGSYDTLTNANEFAQKLSEDLVFISKDKHFRFLFDPAWVADSKKAKTKSEQDELLNRDLGKWRKDNFGFKEIKILDGNIGYLNLTGFKNPKYAGITAEGAIAFLRNADALIIDLRENGGGFSTMVQLLASYFFDGEPIQMGDSYSRETGKHTQDWTLPHTGGVRLPDLPLYILTSKESYSAAEGFAYFLKNRKRAILIGETTGGAAQPIERVAVSDKFYIWLPTQKPVDPTTNTNWEGIGVSPDIPCQSKLALYTAQQEALKMLAGKGIIDSISYKWFSSYNEVLQNSFIIGAKKLQSFAGDFNGRKLIFTNDNLYYQRNGDEPYKLIPMADNLFIIKEANYLRIRINFQNNKVVSITRLYIDGSSTEDAKTK